MHAWKWPLELSRCVAASYHCVTNSSQTQTCARWPTCCKSFVWMDEGPDTSLFKQERYFSVLVTSDVAEGKPSRVRISQLCFCSIDWPMLKEANPTSRANFSGRGLCLWFKVILSRVHLAGNETWQPYLIYHMVSLYITRKVMSAYPQENTSDETEDASIPKADGLENGVERELQRLSLTAEYWVLLTYLSTPYLQRTRVSSHMVTNNHLKF